MFLSETTRPRAFILGSLKNEHVPWNGNTRGGGGGGGGKNMSGYTAHFLPVLDILPTCDVWSGPLF